MNLWTVLKLRPLFKNSTIGFPKQFPNGILNFGSLWFKGQVEKSVLDDIDALIGIDSKKTATVIFFHMYPFINLVLAKLESKPSTLYEFLKYLLELKEGGSQTNSPVHGKIEDPLTATGCFKWEWFIIRAIWTQKFNNCLLFGSYVLYIYCLIFLIVEEP